jgi:hypothetical protein
MRKKSGVKRAAEAAPSDIGRDNLLYCFRPPAQRREGRGKGKFFS